jgi:SnoaL-like polyketide cyclase
MDQTTAESLARSYLAFATGDLSFLSRCSPDFLDHASGRRGLDIFRIVRGWFEESFADVRAELHLVTHTDDMVMMWCTTRGRHIGNGFPRLRGLPVKGNEITWPQVHIFRLEADPKRPPGETLVVEHWAVRDDAALLDSVTA